MSNVSRVRIAINAIAGKTISGPKLLKITDAYEATGTNEEKAGRLLQILKADLLERIRVPEIEATAAARMAIYDQAIADAEDLLE